MGIIKRTIRVGYSDKEFSRRVVKRDGGCMNDECKTKKSVMLNTLTAHHI